MEILLLNLIKGLVIDGAQSLAKEHVEKALDENLNDGQKKVLDALVDRMPENSFKTVKELLG